MTQKSLVSVLMPVYNAEQYIMQTLDSILAQTFTNFEFIIVDDGSSDRSLKILQQYAAEDQRIRLVSRENRGLSRTLNEMLSLAKGEFIARIDADDIALPNRFAEQVAFLQANPNVVCIGSAYQYIDDDGRPLMVYHTPQSNDEIQSGLLTGYADRILHPTIMVRRDTLKAIGGYDETVVAEDLDLFLRLGEVGELANLKAMLTKYRIRSKDCISATKHLAYSKSAQEVCERAWQRRGIEGVFDSGKEGPIRPDASRRSQYPFLVKYGWWGFSSGYRETAIHYAIQAIMMLPLEKDGWRLLACALIKRLPTPEYP